MTLDMLQLSVFAQTARFRCGYMMKLSPRLPSLLDSLIRIATPAQSAGLKLTTCAQMTNEPRRGRFTASASACARALATDAVAVNRGVCAVMARALCLPSQRRCADDPAQLGRDDDGGAEKVRC